MREPGHPCTRRRCRTPVEVMRKAALHGDWHPVPTSLQTRCSPAGPERQSALNSRPLSVLCSTSTLSGPSTPVNLVASRLSFVRCTACTPARLHLWPPVHAGMSMGMDCTWPQHANMPPGAPPRTLCLRESCTLYSLHSLYLPRLCRPSRRATCPQRTDNVPGTTRGEAC